MIYREYLVMRKAVAWFALCVALFMMIVVVAPQSGTTSIGYADLANAASWLGAIFASIFGVALGNGSRDAARVFWVLPAQRWNLALQVIAVDLVGVAAAFACAYVMMLTLATVYFRITVTGTPSAGDIVPALATAYAAYGWSALVGMVGRRIAYLGIIALPAMMIWMTLAVSKNALAAILRLPIVANPFVVYNASQALERWSRHPFQLDPTASSLQWLGTMWGTPVLVAIAIATCGLAVALWQRAEVIN